MKKIVQLLLMSILIYPLLSSADASPSAIVAGAMWVTTNPNGCQQGFVYYQDGNYVYKTTAGKLIVGKYRFENIPNSKKLKLTLQILADNGQAECTGHVANNTGVTWVMYALISDNKNLMGLSESVDEDALLSVAVRTAMEAAQLENLLLKSTQYFLQDNNQGAANTATQRCGHPLPSLIGKWRNELFLPSGTYSETNMTFHANGTMSNDFYSDNQYVFKNEMDQFMGSSNIVSGTSSGTGGHWGVVNNRVQICFTNGVKKQCNVVNGSLMCDLPKSKKRKELWSPVK